MLELLFIIPVLCAVLHAEAGGSFFVANHLPEWLTWLPELLLALVVGLCSYIGFGWIGLVGTAVSYAGIQAATWAYLKWEYNPTPNTKRSATIKPVVDFFAKMLDFKLGDEGYSWIWAAVKGFIITLPVGGTGVITFPLGHEVASHADGRLPGDPNTWRELVSGFAIGLSCLLFIGVLNV